MRTPAALIAAIILAMTGSTLAAGKSVLFIGNSFLFGSGSAVRYYRPAPPDVTKKPAAAQRCVATK